MRTRLGLKVTLCLVFGFAPLNAFSQTSLAEIIPRIKREVVSIRSLERTGRQGQSYDPYFYFFKQPIPAGQKTFPLGTGFVLPSGKHFATSARSIDDLLRVEAVAENGKSSKAKLVGIDRNLDLAVFAFENKTAAFSGVDFGDSKESRLGDPLYLFGNAMKFLMVKTHLAATSASEGAYGRHWLIDRTTNPLVAGGPLVDSRGRVLGMAVFNANGPDDFGTMLPAHLIVQSVKELIQHGKPQRAWLGIVPRFIPNLDELDHIQESSAKTGILIENLIVEGPAAQAGLQIGDAIVSVSGKSLTSIGELYSLIEKMKAGDSVALKVHRASKGIIDLKLTLGELPNARELPNTENLL